MGWINRLGGLGLLMFAAVYLLAAALMNWTPKKSAEEGIWRYQFLTL